jgi:hypothetical protein
MCHGLGEALINEKIHEKRVIFRGLEQRKVDHDGAIQEGSDIIPAMSSFYCLVRRLKSIIDAFICLFVNDSTGLWGDCSR